MSLELAIVTGILMGFVFGFAMEKSRVFEPGMIVGQMQLRNFIMLKVFLTAVATGAVVLAVLNGFGFVKLAPKAALYYADVAVGLILGAGILARRAGACRPSRHPSYCAGAVPALALGFRTRLGRLLRRAWRQGCGASYRPRRYRRGWLGSP